MDNLNTTNQKIFRQTIDAYNSKYEEYTKKLCNNTKVYEDLWSQDVDFERRNTKISVIVGDTVETGRSFVYDNINKVTAILNFADGITPGGLVWQGASTQEEHICRCSNLYASLMTDTASLYYEINNRSVKRLHKHIYADNVIYSKDTLFFRSGKDYRFLTNPYTMDVITCPAPSARLNEKDARLIMMSRIDSIIKSAILNNVDNLILGAWGCGAFGQNPRVVASCFKVILDKYPAFDNVIFAIRNCGADYHAKTTNNYTVFKEILS